MTYSSLSEAVDGFKSDADRVNTFTNGDDTQSYTTKGGQSVPSVQKFLADNQANIDAAAAAVPVALGLVDQAAVSASAAQFAKTAAESARDAALVQAGVYVDEPTGRAAVADGVAFKVQGSGDVAAYEYRRVNSSSSTLIATYPASAAVATNTGDIADVKIRAAVVRIVPLTAANDYPLGQIVDGVYVAWLDPSGVFHSNHTHDGLDQVPGLVGQGILAPTVSLRIIPLTAANDNPNGFIVDGVYAAWVDSVGVWHSTHTHPEIAQLQSDVAALQADQSGPATGWMAREVAVGAEQQVMVHDGSYHQLTPTGANWVAPIVHHGNVVRCLSDYSTGTLEPHTILGSGEIVPDRLGVLIHMIVTGQSLALGSRGADRDANGNVLFVQGVSMTVHSPNDSPFGQNCVSFQTGPRIFSGGSIASAASLTSLIPLKEGFDGNVLGETVCSGLANGMNTWLNDNAHMNARLLMSVSGQGATPYSGLKKGTNAYASAINSVTAGKARATDLGLRYIVPFIYVVHGESETGSLSAATYDGYLGEWISDYATDILAINTQQRQSPVLLLDQMNRQKSTNEGVTLGQLLAHETRANAILIGPKYQHPYYDDAHMLAEGYYKQGLKAKRASLCWMRHGVKWQCLRPVSVSGLGTTTTTIQFNNTVAGGASTPGPIGALALDTTLVTNPGNYGFVCSNAGAPITGVALGGDGTSVVLTHSAPTQAGDTIAYAMQSALNLGTMPTGQNTGSRGCLRDADTRDAVTGSNTFFNNANYNWSVAFRKAIS